MEYTFKNSLTEDQHTVSLKMYSIMIQTDGRETFLPYAGISSVSMTKDKNNFCSVVLESDNYPRLTITNKYFHDAGDIEDRSLEYTKFISTLHSHLKDKSNAIYSSGFSISKFLLRALGVTLFSAAISFVVWVAGLSVVHPVLLTMLLSLISVSLVFLFFRDKLPRQYSPGKLPVKVLP